MDPRKRQLLIRVINEMEKRPEYSKKLGLVNASDYKKNKE